MVYFVSTAILAATMAAFFLIFFPASYPASFPVLGRGPLAPFGQSLWTLRIAVAVPLVVSGVMHFLRTAVMTAIIPPFLSQLLPNPSFLVWTSGILELAGAAGLFFRPTRRLASTCLALLMIAIFPVNIYAAHQIVGGWKMPGVPVRLGMQVIYILLLLTAGWGIPSRLRPRAGDVS